MRPTKRNRGAAAIAMTGFAFAASMGLAVVAIDLGHLSNAAGEVQTLADVAAAGAARSLMQQGGKGEADAEAVVEALLARNTVDGISGAKTARDVQLGTFDFAKGSFSQGGGSPNAVQVTVSATVQNVVAGIYGQPQAEVARAAMAAFSGSASGRPVLPLAIGLCHFAKFQSSGECGSLPAVAQAPSGADGTGWTSLDEDPGGASGAVRYLPSDCGGGGEDPVQLRVGDTLGAMTGKPAAVMKAVQACVKAGHTQFVVPVVDVDCNGGFGKTQTVQGFATVQLSLGAKASKTAALSMDVAAVCSANAAGERPGGPDLGTRSAALVR